MQQQHNPALLWAPRLLGSAFAKFLALFSLALAAVACVLLLVTSQNFQWFILSWSVTVAGPAVLVGTLYLLSWRRRREVAV